MSTYPKVDYDALAALGLLATTAAQQVAIGDPDELVLPMNNCPVLPGEQDDDDVRAIAAIDVLRYLVEHYEENQDRDNNFAGPLPSENRVPVLGDYVETSTYGYRGRVTDMHHRCPQGEAWLVGQRDQSVREHVEEPWVSILVHNGGAVVVPRATTRVVAPFPFVNDFAKFYFGS